MRRPSGDVGDSRARRSRAPRTPTSDAPSKHDRPPPGASRPESARSVVVLPAPLLPSRATISPCADPGTRRPSARGSRRSRRARSIPSSMGTSSMGPSSRGTAAAPRAHDVAAAPGTNLRRPKYASMTRGSALDVRRPPLGDPLAVVEHGDRGRRLSITTRMLCSIRRMVIARSRHEPAQQLHQASRLALGHARRRLVEEEQRRAGTERAAELEPPLLAVGQVARQLVGLVAQAHDLEQLRRPAAHDPSLFARQRGPAGEHLPERQGGISAMHPDQHVLGPPSCWRRGGCSGTCGRCRAR